jgi:hypothetical protein
MNIGAGHGHVMCQLPFRPRPDQHCGCHEWKGAHLEGFIFGLELEFAMTISQLWVCGCDGRSKKRVAKKEGKVSGPSFKYTFNIRLNAIPFHLDRVGRRNVGYRPASGWRGVCGYSLAAEGALELFRSATEH